MGHVPTTSWVTWHFCWLAVDWVKREGHRVMGKGLNCSLVPKHEDCVLDIRIRSWSSRGAEKMRRRRQQIDDIIVI